MAGKVTRLQVQQRSHERVNVYLDEQFAFGLPVLAAAKLHLGQYLTDDDIAALQRLDSEQKAYERALRFLGYRPRSRSEVERNLAEAEISQEIIEAVLARLAAQGYVDDEAFARFWIENREQLGPRGSQALRQELRRKGVTDAAAADALASVDTADGAYRAAQPRAERLVTLLASDERSFRQKLTAFLLRRGFSYADARQAIKRLEEELGSERGMAEDE